ncbi:MAG TPA: MgtC/SapB family protein [Allosphingosinicella sp.]|jgi:uncharacterized membrane protein YhiD involved in acid resistance
MTLHSNPLEVTSVGELALRLGLAALVGLLLGLDREMRGVDAGIRTHALVALSSAMIMMSSLLLYAELKNAGADAPDPRVPSRALRSRSALSPRG